MFTKVCVYHKHKSNIKEVFLEQLIQRAEKKSIGTEKLCPVRNILFQRLSRIVIEEPC